MGIISSTNLKPEISSTDLKQENSEHKSQNNQETQEKVGDSSSGWRNRLEIFMNRGGCKKEFTDFQDCVGEAEKKKEAIGQCLPMLEKCMEAHSDYYKPILAEIEAAEKAFGEVVMKAFLPSTVSLNEINEEEAERFIAFMKGGACKESFTSWHDCSEEAEKNKQDFVIKCAGLFGMLANCVDAHSDYYHSIFAVTKTTDEHIIKDLQALFSDAS